MQLAPVPCLILKWPIACAAGITEGGGGGSSKKKWGPKKEGTYLTFSCSPSPSLITPVVQASFSGTACHCLMSSTPGGIMSRMMMIMIPLSTHGFVTLQNDKSLPHVTFLDYLRIKTLLLSIIRFVSHWPYLAQVVYSFFEECASNQILSIGRITKNYRKLPLINPGLIQLRKVF